MSSPGGSDFTPGPDQPPMESPPSASPRHEQGPQAIAGATRPSAQPLGQQPPVQPPGAAPPPYVPPPVPYPQPPYQPERRRSGLVTCLLVTLVVFVILAVVGVGAVFVLGRRVGSFISRNIIEPDRIAREFLAAADRGDVSAMSALVDSAEISSSDLQDFAAFIDQYCSTITGIRMTNSSFDSTGDEANVRLEYEVSCSANDVTVELSIRRSRTGPQRITRLSWSSV